MHSGALELALVLLLAAVIAVPVFKKLGFGAVLGGEHHRRLARRVVILVGIGKQAEVALHPQDAPHRLVELRHHLRVRFGERGQFVGIDVADHVHVDAGSERQPGSFRAVSSHPVGHELVDRAPIGHQNAIITPFTA